jgi:RNA polymerase sigma factor (sigma-70 family)
MAETKRPGWPTSTWAQPTGEVGDITGPEAAEWQALWARCWSRIRSWRVPPHWSAGDWSDEARALGALAACEARRSFDPGRMVPLEAYLYRRVVEGVWARYRREWGFARRCRPAGDLSERPAAEPDRLDRESIERLARILEALGESDQCLIRRLFWDDRTEDQLAGELGVSRQAVNKRKQKLLRQLRAELGRAGGP